MAQLKYDHQALNFCQRHAHTLLCKFHLHYCHTSQLLPCRLLATESPLFIQTNELVTDMKLT